MNQRIQRARKYLEEGKDYKRWRLWRCIQGSEAHRRVESKEEIGWLELKGFKAKIHTPLPKHKTSGHTHIVVLATFHEFCMLAGIPIRIKGKVKKQ